MNKQGPSQTRRPWGKTLVTKRCKRQGPQRTTPPSQGQEAGTQGYGLEDPCYHASSINLSKQSKQRPIQAHWPQPRSPRSQKLQARSLVADALQVNNCKKDALNNTGLQGHVCRCSSIKLKNCLLNHKGHKQDALEAKGCKCQGPQTTKRSSQELRDVTWDKAWKSDSYHVA